MEKPLHFRNATTQRSVNNFFDLLNIFLQIYRSSRRRCSVRKDVLRNFAEYTGKHLCQSLFFNEGAGLLQNTFFTEHSGRLLLTMFLLFLKKVFYLHYQMITSFYNQRRI